MGEPGNPMVRFLLSLGIEPPSTHPEPCPHCRAEWPWCNWDFAVRNDPPCKPAPTTPPSGEDR